MKDQDRLLNEILAEDELADFRRASLERGIAAMRSQNRRRRAVNVCALVLLPALMTLAILLNQARTPSVLEATSHPQPHAAPAPSRPSPGVQFISDEELFALFPDRAMALVGKPGDQQLVFLDKPARSTLQ